MSTHHPCRRQEFSCLIYKKWLMHCPLLDSLSNCTLMHPYNHMLTHNFKIKSLKSNMEKRMNYVQLTDLRLTSSTMGPSEAIWLCLCSTHTPWALTLSIWMGLTLDSAVHFKSELLEYNSYAVICSLVRVNSIKWNFSWNE